MESICPFNNVLTFPIVTSHINTVGSRSYSTSSKKSCRNFELFRVTTMRLFYLEELFFGISWQMLFGSSIFWNAVALFFFAGTGLVSLLLHTHLWRGTLKTERQALLKRRRVTEEEEKQKNEYGKVKWVYQLWMHWRRKNYGHGLYHQQIRVANPLRSWRLTYAPKNITQHL